MQNRLTDTRTDRQADMRKETFLTCWKDKQHEMVMDSRSKGRKQGKISSLCRQSLVGALQMYICIPIEAVLQDA